MSNTAKIEAPDSLFIKRLQHNGFDLTTALPRLVSRKHWGDFLVLMAKDYYPNLTRRQRMEMVQRLVKDLKKANPE